MKIAAATLIATFTLAAAASGAEYPEKPIRIVVPNPAGGTVDIVTRAVAQGLGVSLGQPVVVDIKPGGNNVIGADAVARAAPDGYTLLMGGTHLTINPLMRKLPYDGMNAFTPVALLAATPNVIAVNASLPVRNVAELVALAKARPKELNCATATPGNGTHLAAERFRSQAGIELNFIPFQGGVQAALAVAGGHADVLVAPLSDAAPHHASGKLRILAVTSPQRFEILPDIPTLAESGFAGFHSLQWFGAVAPAGTPRPVVTRLSAEMRRSLDNPDVRASFARLGLSVMPLSAEQFDEFLRNETRAFAAIIRDGNIKAE
jgi:tripartite-type tricarboxylate transporter receptor subunit TctC